MNRYDSYFSKMASQSSLFHPLTPIKAQTAKQFRLRQQLLNVPRACARDVKSVICYQRRQ
jgi:hypothetical protein